MGERTWRQNEELWVTGLLQPILALLGPLCGLGRRGLLLAAAALPVYLLLAPVWRRAGCYLEREGETGLGRWCSILLLGLSSCLLVECLRRGVVHLEALAGSWDRRVLTMALLLLALWLTRERGRVLGNMAHILYIVVMTAFALSLILSLPGLSWERALYEATGDVDGLRTLGRLLGLSGGIFCIYHPARVERRTGRGVVKGWLLGMGALVTVWLAFGPGLAGEMGEPFYYLIEGIEVPGVFQRGEAVLTAVFGLADLVMVALLLSAVERHGRRGLQWKGRTSVVVVGVLAVILSVGGREMIDKGIWLWLGCGIGILVPILLWWREKGKERTEMAGERGGA